jgi:hypothetical protein
MEFVSKKKTVKVTIDDKSYQMSLPSMGQVDEIITKVSAVETSQAGQAYMEFFSELGLPVEACKKMDSVDFIEFIGFVMSPKKKT